MNAILLIGFMGAGKSTVGRQLAADLDLPFLDLDTAIEAEIQMSIADYFATQGEASFRQIESCILQEIVAQEAVVACGGGIILQPQNHQLLKRQPNVVYLQTNPDQLYQRISQDTQNQRPLADEKTAAEVTAILQPRLPLYQEAASLVVVTDDKTPAIIATEIIERLGKQ